MKIYKIAANYDEMKGWFEKRTNKHIESVQKFCKKIEDYDPKRFKGLVEQAKDHDQSKFKDPEIKPYVYTTWKYKCKDDGVKFECPKEMEEKMIRATEHHCRHNKHHPEYWDTELNMTDFINKKDRDKSIEGVIIDATKMPELDLSECVADWFAVSEERGNHPKDWADKNVNIRWKFTDKQKNLIYELIEEIWQ